MFLLLSYMSQTKVRIFQMCTRMQRASSKCALGRSAHLPNVRSDATCIFQMCARMQCASSKCALGCSAHLRNMRSDALRIFQMCARTQCASSKCALGCNVHLRNVRSDAVRIFQMCARIQSASSKCALGCSAHLQNMRSDATRIFQLCARMQRASSKCALGCNAHLPNMRSDATRIFQMCARMQRASSKCTLLCSPLLASRSFRRKPIRRINTVSFVFYSLCVREAVTLIVFKFTFPEERNSTVHFSLCCSIVCNAKCNLITILPKAVRKLNKLSFMQQLACDFMIQHFYATVSGVLFVMAAASTWLAQSSVWYHNFARM